MGVVAAIASVLFEEGPEDFLGHLAKQSRTFWALPKNAM